jgi:hypothetical protein
MVCCCPHPAERACEIVPLTQTRVGASRTMRASRASSCFETHRRAVLGLEGRGLASRCASPQHEGQGRAARSATPSPRNRGAMVTFERDQSPLLAALGHYDHRLRRRANLRVYPLRVHCFGIVIYNENTNSKLWAVRAWRRNTQHLAVVLLYTGSQVAPRTCFCAAVTGGSRGGIAVGNSPQACAAAFLAKRHN